MKSQAKQIAEFCSRLPNIWMGILNATPDSFSDGGTFNSPDAAIERARAMIMMGAHIIDVGGVSTQPGSKPISAEEELSRVFPVVRALRREFPFAFLSLDSYRPSVVYTLAREGLIDLVNDIYAGRIEESVECEVCTTISVAARFGLGIILMHMQGEPNTMQNSPTYSHCIEEVRDFLATRATVAHNAGVQFVAIDPGIGFGKKLEDNLSLLSAAGMNSLASLGYPIVIGLSRKRFISEMYPDDKINLSIPANRDKRSKELETRALEFGATIVRSHTMPDEFPP
jgi:dihydropteroate synthase